ncbi:MAG: hypothetical protein ACC661_06450 [Verrucomicrobiales bacterium]
MNKMELAARWGFLEEEPEPCAVVSATMELLYLNRAARPLVPPCWQGRRCWQAFPVGERSCASRCPAVKAVAHSKDIVYCEEQLFPPDGQPIALGVAAIPLERALSHGEKALLLFRPKGPQKETSAFRQNLTEKAGKLKKWSLARLETLGAD